MFAPHAAFADCIMTQRGKPDRIPAEFRAHTPAENVGRGQTGGGRGTGIQHSPGAPAQLSELARNLADKSALQEAKSDPALLDKEICT